MKYKSAILYGVLSGIAIICYHLGVYFWNKPTIISAGFFYSVYLVHIPFMIASGLKFRMTHDGLIDYKEALREVFITFLVGMAIYYVLYYGLFNYDLELVGIQKQQAFDHYELLLENDVIKKKEYNNFMTAWEKDDYKVTIGSIIPGIPFRIIGGFVLSALVALMVKR